MSDAPPEPRPRAGLALGRVRGVPLFVAPSWLIVAALLTAIYAPVIHDAVPHIGRAAAYVAAAAFAVLFGGCVLAHEIGHTLVSLALGHPVRRVVLFALGGVSELDGEPDRARDELLIAGSGPLVSLVLGGAAVVGYVAAPTGTLFTALLGLLGWSNLLLTAFNLLPGLPLDGGRLLRALVHACGARPLTATRVAAWAGRAVALAVAVAGLVLDRTTSGFAAGLFSLALAGYLWFGASQSLKAAELMAGLPGVDVRQLLRPGMLIPADLSVGEALRRARESQARGLVIMDGTARPSAIVDEAMIGAVPPQRRPWTPVAAVARPLEPGLLVPEDVDAPELLRRMQRTPAREYLVVHPDGSPAGIIATRDFMQRLLARAGS
jgi:Zn-dependent protease